MAVSEATASGAAGAELAGTVTDGLPEAVGLEDWPGVALGEAAALDSGTVDEVAEDGWLVLVGALVGAAVDEVGADEVAGADDVAGADEVAGTELDDGSTDGVEGALVGCVVDDASVVEDGAVVDDCVVEGTVVEGTVVDDA